MEKNHQNTVEKKTNNHGRLKTRLPINHSDPLKEPRDPNKKEIQAIYSKTF